ncbi:transcription antitermination factor NusB [Spiroplasma tabanidicola]|uniref:Transcription antitermination protein NusB n=1 Tax=Spiroplasma tabanidicola TaxID=324079 RepID=A0A6I6CIQ1_9MOLU|nr:transcription antitermination factor NusB [Spiroplasma tabanidicola]QGS51943.1 transcription antitermination protein NusB [Spiroplasma tabanidicola]
MEKSVSYLKKQRRNTVQILYKVSLLNEQIDKIKQELLDNTQFEEINDDLSAYITNVLNQFDDLKQELKKYIPSNWSWERLPNMIKAILISSAFEIINNINPKGIVINESLDMVREFLPSWDTNFVNAILDKLN